MITVQDIIGECQKAISLADSCIADVQNERGKIRSSQSNIQSSFSGDPAARGAYTTLDTVQMYLDQSESLLNNCKLELSDFIRIISK